MSEMNYKTFTCPRCGNTETFDENTMAAIKFRYGAVWVLHHDVELTEGGYDCRSCDFSDIVLHEDCTVICAECGYEGEMEEFES